MNQADCLQQFLAYLRHVRKSAWYEYLYGLITPGQYGYRNQIPVNG